MDNDNDRREPLRTPLSSKIKEKVPVNIWCSLTYIGDIDVVKQQFTCEFWMAATWTEPNLEGKKNEDIDWDKEWNPKLTFANAITIERMQKVQRLHYVEQGRDVPYAQEMFKVRGTFKEHMDLTDFPLDYQELSIMLSSDWTDKHLTFQKDKLEQDSIRHHALASPQEWSLCDHVHTDTTSLVRESPGASDRSYPMYILTSHLKRKAAYYIWNIMLFMFVITGLSFASFAVTPKMPGSQLTVTLTTLLTGVAFKIAVSKHLPFLLYSTLLDKYILVHLLFICFVAILNALTSLLSQSSRAMYMYKVACVAGGLGLLLVIQVVAVIIGVYKTRMVNRELAKFANLYQEKADKIERLRRERDWYAERNKQPNKTPIIVLTPATITQFTLPRNGIAATKRSEESAAPGLPKSYV